MIKESGIKQMTLPIKIELVSDLDSINTLYKQINIKVSKNQNTIDFSPNKAR